MVMNLRDKVLAYLREDVRQVERMNDLSVHTFQSLNVHPMVYSFVVPVSTFLPNCGGYFNVVFYKNPHQTNLFVSQVVFYSEEKAVSLAKTLLLSSGRYITGKRFAVTRK